MRAPQQRIASGFRLAQQLSTAVVLGIGTMAVAGWILGLSSLTRILPHLPPMMFNSALCFLLLGLALLDVLRHQGRAERLARGAALIVCLIALMTLAQYAFGRSLGIDNLFMSHPRESGLRWPGRMDLITAISFLASGLALLTLDLKLTRRWTVGAVLAYLPPLPALFTLFDLLFQASIAKQLSPGLGAMSLHTAVAFFATAMALITLHTTAGLPRLFRHNGAVGRAARFQFLVVLPLVIGLIVITQLGVDTGVFPERMALAVRSMVLILALVAAFWHSLEDLARADRATLRALRETEAARDSLEDAVQVRTLELSASNTALTREIAERHRLSVAVEESERRFRQLVVGAPVGIMLLDGEGMLSYANPVMQEICDQAEGALLGGGWMGVVHPDDLDPILTQCHTALRDGTITQQEGRLQRPDGRTAWGAFRFQPLRGSRDNLTGLVGTVAEITRRKEAEELLRIQKEELEQLLHMFQRDVGREVEGTGAGLAIVRQVARRHRGEAWVEERPGGGAAFTLTFGPEAR